MMTPEEALVITNNILKPRQLNETEELVFLKTLSGMRYEEISAAIQYDTSYIRDVGARIWRALSQSLGCKVSKKNIRLRLQEFSDAEGYTLEIKMFPPPGTLPMPMPGSLIYPSSTLCIRRPELEQKIYNEIHKPGSIVSLKAPAKMGKTSLAHQALYALENTSFHIVYIKLAQADHSIIHNLSQLLRWILINIEKQLGIPSELDLYWLEEAGSKVSCTAYLQEFLLPRLDGPFILLIDDIACLSAAPIIFQDFLAMLRHWHELAALCQIWGKLRLMLIQNTENYIPLELEYSPFNVGLSIKLPGLTVQQASKLAESYRKEESELSIKDVEDLVRLTDGHPYLLHLTFKYLFDSQTCPNLFIKDTGYYHGIYNNFMREKISVLRENPELLLAFKKIISETQAKFTLSTASYQLESMGLIKSQRNLFTVKCPLYQELMVEEVACF